MLLFYLQEALFIEVFLELGVERAQRRECLLEWQPILHLFEEKLIHDVRQQLLNLWHQFLLTVIHQYARGYHTVLESLLVL